jgi:hypothetical protein
MKPQSLSQMCHEPWPFVWEKPHSLVVPQTTKCLLHQLEVWTFKIPALCGTSISLQNSWVQHVQLLSHIHYCTNMSKRLDQTWVKCTFFHHQRCWPLTNNCNNSEMNETRSLVGRIRSVESWSFRIILLVWRLESSLNGLPFKHPRLVNQAEIYSPMHSLSFIRIKQKELFCIQKLLQSACIWKIVWSQRNNMSWLVANCIVCSRVFW